MAIKVEMRITTGAAQSTVEEAAFALVETEPAFIPVAGKSHSTAKQDTVHKN